MSAETRKQASEAFAEMFPLPLFMQPTPAHNGTRTSREAAHAIKEHADKQRARLLAFYAARGTDGATDQEAERETGLAGNSIRPRRGELMERGCIRDSGRTRRSASGRACVVWEFVK